MLGMYERMYRIILFHNLYEHQVSIFYIILILLKILRYSNEFFSLWSKSPLMYIEMIVENTHTEKSSYSHIDSKILLRVLLCQLYETKSKNFRCIL